MTSYAAQTNRNRALGQLLIIALLLGGAYLWWHMYSSQAATSINATVTTDTSINQGLIGHWTFDGSDLELFASAWATTTIRAYEEDRDTNDEFLSEGTTTKEQAVTPGRLGQGLYFNGETRLKDSGSGVQYYSAFDSTSHSVGIWFRSTGAPGGIMIGKRSANCGTSVAAQLNLTLSNELQYIVRDDTGANVALVKAAPGEYLDDEWHYAVGVRNGASAYLYVDGVLVGQDSGAGGTITTSAVYLGACAAVDASLTYPFVGSLDDLRIYDRALTEGEVNRLYQTVKPSEVNNTLSVPGLEEGLVGHWTFDGMDVDWASSTAEIRDVSGNGRHGNASSTMNSNKSTTAGLVGQGMTLDGSLVEYVEIADADVFTPTTTGMSVSVWVKPTLDVGLPIEISKAGINLREWFLSSGFGAGKCTPEARVWDESEDGQLYAQSLVSVPCDDEWFHVVSTYDGGSTTAALSIFVNGEETGITNEIGTFDAVENLTEPVRFGKTIASNFDGTYDDIRIYSRVLTNDEIVRLYQMGEGTKTHNTLSIPNLEQGLVGHWTFDGMDVDWASSTAEILDVSGGNYHGNASTSLTTNSAVPGVIGQGLYFDVSEELIYVPSNVPIEGTTEHSVCTWLKTTGTVSMYVADLVSVFDLRIKDTDNRIRYRVSGASTKTLDSTAAVNTGEWVHFCGTYNASDDAHVYINGVLDDGLPGGTLPATTGSTVNDLTIGGDLIANEDLTGSLDDFRIYDRTLSAEEVEQLYNLGR